MVLPWPSSSFRGQASWIKAKFPIWSAVGSLLFFWSPLDSSERNQTPASGLKNYRYKTIYSRDSHSSSSATAEHWKLAVAFDEQANMGFPLLHALWAIPTVDVSAFTSSTSTTTNFFPSRRALFCRQNLEEGENCPFWGTSRKHRLALSENSSLGGIFGGSRFPEVWIPIH